MRLMIVSGYGYWGKFNPASFFEDINGAPQVAGGETAMVQTATELAKKGHEVFLFYDTDRPKHYRGVDYLPTSLFVPLVCQMDFDVLVTWDNPHVLRFADRAKVRALAFQLNDPQVGVFDWALDLYFHPSQWHLKRTKESCPEVTASKQRARITNGIDYSRYTEAGEVEKELRVVYSSSPDRGLHHLFRIWPEVHSRVPKAELHVYYDMNMWLEKDKELRKRGIKSITSDRAEEIRKYLALGLPNVVFHGGIGQRELAKEQLKGHVLAYPCDPVRPTEGYSMTILESIVAGMYVLTTGVDALEELWKEAPNVTILPHVPGEPFQDDLWIEKIVETLARKDPIKGIQHNALYSWKHVADLWEREFELCLKDKA